MSEPAAMNLEVEVKFLVPDLTAVRQRLLAAGANLHKPLLFERNVRFDTPDNNLMKRSELLRLRQDTAVTLTFKGAPLDVAQSEAQVREELEEQVDDWETAVAISARLGFQPRWVYEKYRETFHLGEVEVMLDELPYGNFVGLEGPEADIKAAAAELGLDWKRRILTNYLSLMAQLKAYHNLPFDDLTFDNFIRSSVSIADILGQ